MSDRLASPCTLVQAARTALENTRSNAFGLLEAPEKCIQICVSRGQVARALRIADALLKACEARGWAASIEDGKTLVRVGEVPIGLSLEEALETVELPVKPTVETNYAFNYKWTPDTIKKPSGLLVLSLHEQQYLWRQSLRRNWRDPQAPLEERLNDVIVGMLKMAAAVAAENARREREAKADQERKLKEQAAAEEQRRLRAELANEKARVEKLREQATRWRESENLRRFVAEAQRRGMVPEAGGETGVTEWADWAIRQADRIDPFTPSPHSIIDEEQCIERMCERQWSYR